MVYFILYLGSVNRHKLHWKLGIKHSKRGLALKGLKKKKLNFEIAQNLSIQVTYTTGLQWIRTKKIQF